VKGSSTNYASQGRILRVGESHFVPRVETKTGENESNKEQVRQEPRSRPVKIAVGLSCVLAMVCGYVSTLPIPSKTESGSQASALLSSDVFQRAVIEYQRPDLAGRIAAAAAIPVPPTRKKSLVPVVPSVAEKDVEPRKGGKRLSHKQLVDKVYGIIKTHAPKHQNGRTLADAIVTEASVQQYDPLFVAAVIKSESTFNAMARSHKGAQGLMQIMPKTGAWLAKKEEMPRGSLTDPGYNLKLGITYLKHLEEMFDGNRVFVLIAYNWGPGHVESASEGKRKVPSEVVTYAVKIMNDFRRWSHLA
jgi:hypothetical protein